MLEKKFARNVWIRLCFAIVMGAVTIPVLAGVAIAQSTSAEPPSTDIVPTGVAALLPRDLSPWGMFLYADIVVKVVMAGLVLASIVTWTVWVAKTYELWIAKKKARAAIAALARVRVPSPLMT